jgi:hypothetical protein
MCNTIKLILTNKQIYTLMKTLNYISILFITTIITLITYNIITYGIINYISFNGI